MDDLTLNEELDNPVSSWMALGLTQHPSNGLKCKKTRPLSAKKERKWDFLTKMQLKTKHLV
jgi:hypothetical protein